jgi:hypothetical protein
MKKDKSKADEQHSFTRKVCHWPYCAKCGLVALKNEPTRIAMTLGCGWEDKIKGKHNATE